MRLSGGEWIDISDDAEGEPYAAEEVGVSVLEVPSDGVLPVGN